MPDMKPRRMRHLRGFCVPCSSSPASPCRTCMVRFWQNFRYSLREAGGGCLRSERK